MKKIIDGLFSTRAAGLYIFLFALAIGTATFIENDYGTSSAQKVVFQSRWFELLLLLFAITLVVNILRYRMIQQKKWGTLTFHASIIIILAGSAITRYTGSEGIMHIREGSTSNQILSSETYLQFAVKQNGNTYQFDERVLFASLGNNKFKGSYLVGGEEIKVQLEDFIPNPIESIIDDDQGMPLLKLVASGGKGGEEYILKENDLTNIDETWINFGEKEIDYGINIQFRNDSLLIKSPTPLVRMLMATQQRDTLQPATYWPLMIRTLYSTPNMSLVVGDFKVNGKVTTASSSPKMDRESIGAASLNITVGNESKTVMVSGNKGFRGLPATVALGSSEISVAYGPKTEVLPFSLRLRDFIMDRYPGTNSASSYASEVTLIDPDENVNLDQRIFMNNILNYKGYRFFQSSYDQDELGTVLSVNHDAWGTWVSYLGYFLLTLGLILTLFSPKSRFRQLSNQLKRMHVSAKPVMTLMALLISSALWSQSSKDAINNLPEVSAEHAAKFGKMIVQDHRGRMKPMNTMASEVLRKIARKESIHGQNADQVFIGMIVFPDHWIQVPLIKLGRHEEVKNILNVDGPLVSYNDFFQDGYKLRDYGKEAHSKEPQDRGAFDKEIIKLDEKVNICNMVFASRLMRLFPEPNHPGNQWISPGEASHQSNPSQETPDFHAFFNGYKASVLQAVKTQDWSQADQFLDELVSFQEKFGSAVLPNDSKISLEIWLNKMNVFGRLGRYYGLFGLLFLFTFFITVFKSNLSPVWPLRIGMLLMAALFLLHTTGLGVRWYVSGRAPWSNGYESMIYIAWTTVLAGLVFARRTFGGLAATAVLASTILMVAGLSWMDPEITPLVPVLKSYWLTIHVSLEAGSYGFLMLGAIIGILNLLLMIFTSRHNDQRNYRKIRELTLISEMTLIAGLVMVSVGTYLGGVWANESWGRYWGWDAKETWALVTILVYTFILHMRFIPGLRGLYAFNLASLFGFASVMMTYFGVNYYLSGLHSYAAGDPVPIPPSVYYTAAIFTLIGILAYWKFRQHQNEYVSKSDASQETV